MPNKAVMSQNLIVLIFLIVDYLLTRKVSTIALYDIIKLLSLFHMTHKHQNLPGLRHPIGFMLGEILDLQWFVWRHKAQKLRSLGLILIVNCNNIQQRKVENSGTLPQGIRRTGVNFLLARTARITHCFLNSFARIYTVLHSCRLVQRALNNKG